MSAVVWPLLRAVLTYPNSVGPDIASTAGPTSVSISSAMADAPERESTPSGVANTVICTGKEISRKTRPTSAGLNGLQPRPPNVIFPTPIATSAPSIIIHTGNDGGRLKPSRTPVTTAEQSPTVGRPFNR